MLLVPLGRLPALVLDGARRSHHKWRDAVCSRDWTCHVPLMRAWINKWHHGNRRLGGELNKGCRKITSRAKKWLTLYVVWRSMDTLSDTPLFWVGAGLSLSKPRFSVCLRLGFAKLRRSERVWDLMIPGTRDGGLPRNESTLSYKLWKTYVPQPSN